MKRLYYVGDEPDFTDDRLAGVVLNYGNAVDVHDETVAKKLLAQPHFAEQIVAARPVVRDTKKVPKPKAKPKPVPEPEVGPEPEQEDLEVDDDDT